MALQVCLVVLGLLVPGFESWPAFGLEEVISGGLSSRGFAGNWISGSQFIYTDMKGGDVLRYDLHTLSTSMLVSRAVLEEYRATSYELTADGLFLLLGYDTQKGFRHSTVSRFVLYDLTRHYYIPLAGGALLQLVRLAPVGSGLVYVYNNNLYYRMGPAGREVQLTNTGVPGTRYNGVPDWVYEEEVLGSGSAVWFSPDGTRLAFASFDDSNVMTESYFHYGSPGSLEHQYSDTMTIRYPKPGTPIPRVSLQAVDLTVTLPNSMTLEPPVAVVSSDHILYAVSWANNEEVAAVWTNRVQNIAQASICAASTGVCHDVHRHSESAGWVDVMSPVFDDAGDRYATVLPQPTVNGPLNPNFRHLTVVSRDGQENPLTAGRYVVKTIHGWDKINDIIYYDATPEDAPSQQHVYGVAADGSSAPRCLSCHMKTLEGHPCLYAMASFSTDLSHVALTCAGPDPAHVELYRTQDNHQLLLWEDNQALRMQLEGRDLPIIYNTELSLPNFWAKVRLYVGPHMDTSGRTKYPMLVYVYGGPDSVQISDTFKLGWGAYLTTNRSVIYAMIDGRGSGLKGDAMKFSMYRRLGTVEVYDQISVAARLSRTYPFIDNSRIGIWGWSYGGYATAMALARDTARVFKCGASVAPVTSWIYYDAVYTERYMGLPTPEDNLSGYNVSDVTRRVENFRGRPFYLLHGNADDNVHYLQAMMLSRALELNNILFRQQSYPDENHNLASVLVHVYRSMDQFWQRCFSL